MNVPVLWLGVVPELNEKLGFERLLCVTTHDLALDAGQGRGPKRQV